MELFRATKIASITGIKGIKGIVFVQDELANHLPTLDVVPPGM